jgi:hypothetical protein
MGQHPSPRASHCADYSDRADALLVTGGDCGTVEGAAVHVHVLSLNSLEWSLLTCEGTAPRGCIGHASSMIGERLFLSGGFVPRTSSAEKSHFSNALHALDLTTSPPCWARLEGGTTLPPRRDHTLTAVTPPEQPGLEEPSRHPGASLLCFGGWNLLTTRGDVHRWAAKRGWAAVSGGADAHAGKSDSTPGMLAAQGQLDSSSPSLVLPQARRGHSATLVPQAATVFVWGGAYGVATYLGDLFVLGTEHLPAASWRLQEASGSAPAPRAWHSMTHAGSGWLVLFGGACGSIDEGMVVLNDLHVLDTHHLRWAPLEAEGIPPSPRCSHTATLVGGALYVFGGRSEHEGRHERLHGDVSVLQLGGVLPERTHSRVAAVSDDAPSCSSNSVSDGSAQLPSPLGGAPSSPVRSNSERLKKSGAARHFQRFGHWVTDDHPDYESGGSSADLVSRRADVHVDSGDPASVRDPRDVD